MKNLVKCFIVVAVVVTGMANTVTAKSNNLQVCDTIIPDTTKKEVALTSMLNMSGLETTWTKIDVADLPKAVVDAVSKKYEGYTIDEAYKGDDDQYKLVIKKEVAKLVVIFDKDGKFIEELEA